MCFPLIFAEKLLAEDMTTGSQAGGTCSKKDTWMISHEHCWIAFVRFLYQNMLVYVYHRWWNGTNVSVSLVLVISAAKYANLRHFNAHRNNHDETSVSTSGHWHSKPNMHALALSCWRARLKLNPLLLVEWTVTHFVVFFCYPLLYSFEITICAESIGIEVIDFKK